MYNTLTKYESGPSINILNALKESKVGFQICYECQEVFIRKLQPHKPEKIIGIFTSCSTYGCKYVICIKCVEKYKDNKTAEINSCRYICYTCPKCNDRICTLCLEPLPFCCSDHLNGHFTCFKKEITAKIKVVDLTNIVIGYLGHNMLY
jgi:hypothetical protein